MTKKRITAIHLKHGVDGDWQNGKSIHDIDVGLPKNFILSGSPDDKNNFLDEIKQYDDYQGYPAYYSLIFSDKKELRVFANEVAAVELDNEQEIPNALYG